jgi:transcriptional regulator GlxA family with amidase domain
MNVGIYIYDQAEVLDFSGPFEVFSTASRVCVDAEPFTVFLIGECSGVIRARAGYRVLADYSIHDHPPLDVLIVAGGMHCDEMHKPQVIGWLQTAAEQAQLTASVCTGAFLLAQAGVFTSDKVTTHWQDITELRELFPGLTVLEDLRWVDAGDRVSSAGISAGIDMSLHLVSRLHSPELARRTARQMDFDWQHN